MAFIKSKITLLLFLGLLFSCVKEDEVDFSQLDNLKFDQQITGSLISFTATLPDFIDADNLPITTFELAIPLDIFNIADIQSRLKEVALHFEFENTFNRDFEFVFNFLDTNDTITYSILVNIDGISKSSHDEFIEGLDIEDLIKSKKVKIIISVLNNNTIDNTPGAFINLKSSVSFFF